MRILIGEDETLLREGLSWSCRSREWRSSAQSPMRTRSSPWPASRSPTWCSPTFVCHPPAPTTGCGPRVGSVPFDRAQPSWCCHSSSSAATPWSCSPNMPPASATCSSSASSTYRPSAGTYGGLPTAGLPSTPKWLPLMMTRSLRDDEALDSLTPRRREVLALIAEGLNNAAIARRLSISEKAVVVHTSGIYDALGIPVDGDEHRRVLAVVRYLGR